MNQKISKAKKGDEEAFVQVDTLRKDGRIDIYAEADYTEGTMAYMWLTKQTEKIAESIYETREEEGRRAVGKAPTHIIRER